MTDLAPSIATRVFTTFRGDSPLVKPHERESTILREYIQAEGDDTNLKHVPCDGPGLRAPQGCPSVREAACGGAQARTRAPTPTHPAPRKQQ